MLVRPVLDLVVVDREHGANLRGHAM